MAPRRKKQRTGGGGVEQRAAEPGAAAMGVDVAEAVGRLLLAPPDVLNNIQTACRDVAAFACVCKASSIVAKQTLWRLLGEHYPQGMWGDAIPPGRRYEAVHLGEVTVRELLQGTFSAVELQDVPQHVPHQVAAEFARLQPLVLAATNARRFYCLSDRELQQLPSVALHTWSALESGRLYRLQHLVAAARAKHGSAVAFWRERGRRKPVIKPRKPEPCPWCGGYHG